MTLKLAPFMQHINCGQIDENGVLHSDHSYPLHNGDEIRTVGRVWQEEKYEEPIPCQQTDFYLNGKHVTRSYLAHYIQENL